MALAQRWTAASLVIALTPALVAGGDKAPPEKAKGAPPADAKFVEVVLEGVGKNEKEAVKTAYRGAVSRVVETLVDADALLKYDELIAERILDVSGGFVKAHEVLKKDETPDGLIRVRVKVTVERLQIADRLADAKVPRKPALSAGNLGATLLADKNAREAARKDATTQLAKLYEEIPDLVTATVRGKPRIAPDKTGVVVDADVGVELKAYTKFVERATGVFGKIASAQEPGTFTGAVGVRRLFVSYDEDFPNLKLDKLSVPTGAWPANLFPESVLKERIKRIRPASEPGYGVWLMTAADARYQKTRWTFYWVDADYQESTKDLRGEPVLVIRLLDKDGKVIVERDQPLLKLVGADGFKRFFVVQRPQFVTSVNVPKAKSATPPETRTPDRKLAFAHTLEIAPLVWWDGSICTDVGIGYSPTIQHSVLIKLNDDQLARVDKVEVSVSLRGVKQATENRTPPPKEPERK
jgi:hypothetical protein